MSYKARRRLLTFLLIMLLPILACGKCSFSMDLFGSSDNSYHEPAPLPKPAPPGGLARVLSFTVFLVVGLMALNMTAGCSDSVRAFKDKLPSVWQGLVFLVVTLLGGYWTYLYMFQQSLDMNPAWFNLVRPEDGFVCGFILTLVPGFWGLAMWLYGLYINLWYRKYRARV
jgi:hypothetical protein